MFIARSLVRSLTFAVLVCALVACGSGGSDTVVTPAAQETQSIVVTPSLGRIRNGLARARRLDGTALSDETSTGTAGTATLRIPAGYRGPLIIGLTGAPDATYFDEGSGQETPFPADRQIRVAMTDPRPSVGVSVLTELALSLAEASGQTLDAAAIEAANERIRAALAPDVVDLLTPPVIVDANTAAGAVAGTDGGKLAARLAALAKLAPGDASPALTVLAQLADDISDGVVDGVGANGAIAGLSYSATNFATDFVAAVRAFADAFGDQALRDASSSAQANARVDGTTGGGTGGGGTTGGGTTGGGTTGGGTTGGGTTGGGTSGGTGLDPDGDGINGTTSPGTVNAELLGTFTLTYSDRSPNNDRDPFADGQEVQVTISADGSITLGSISLANPFNRSISNDGSPHLPEIIWYDASTDLEYALSDNARPVFNEINVGDASMPQEQTFGLPAFLGQLRPPAPPPETGATTLATYAGFFDALVVSSCRSSSCPNPAPAGQTVAVGIDNAGVISFGDLRLDPATEGATFSDFRSGTIQPRLSLTVPNGMNSILQAEVFIDDSAQPPSGTPVRGIRLLQRIENRSASLTVEARELRASYTDYFNNFVTRVTPPLKLTYVVDGSDYSGKATTLTTAPGGASALCRSFDLSAVIAPTEAPGASGTDFRPQFAWISGNQRVEPFQQSFSRLSTNAAGERVMSGLGIQFVLAPTHVRIEEGIGSAVSTSEIVIAMPKDVATSDPAAIATACSEFISLGGTVSYTQGGSVTLSIKDTAADKEIYSRVFSFTGSGSQTWDELLPSGLAYEISATAFGASSPTCTVSTPTGTLTAPVGDANVSCAPSP